MHLLPGSRQSGSHPSQRRHKMYRRLAMPLGLFIAVLTIALVMLPLPSIDAQTDSRYFPQTHHWVRGLFLKYWNEHGGLAQQGYPLTEEFQEQNKLNGETYTVQYFERSIFEHHPENAGTPYEVLLSQLGKFQLDSRYPNGSTPTATPVPTGTPSATTTPLADAATPTVPATLMPSVPPSTE